MAMTLTFWYLKYASTARKLLCTTPAIFIFVLIDVNV